MDHRERVLTAIHHIEPDRVPTALWGSAYGPTDPLYMDLLRHFNLGAPVAPFRRRCGHSVNYYDDRVLDALDVDTRHVWLGFTDLGGPPAGGGLDAWGVTWEQLGIYLGAVKFPLVQPKDLEHYQFPQVDSFVRVDELRARARYLKEKTDYAVFGRAVDSYGPLERCCNLRGVENFMVDLGTNEEFVNELVTGVTDVFCRLIEIYLDAAGRYLDVFELPGDDYAAQNPIISPKMFDQYFFKAWQRMITLVRQAAPHCKILFHSDGRMEPFMDRLVALGVDVFHCLEPLPRVSMAEVKSKYGGKLCFLGAIDIKQALQGDVARVEAEVQERIRVLAPGGGYIVAPANHLQPDVPAQNVVALYQAARQYGKYPLD